MKFAPGDIISYMDMCQEEQAALQRGMNFKLRGLHSIILMSLRPNAPYEDEIQEDGKVLIYEGHDVPRSADCTDPKSVDQPRTTPTGRLTQNGLFEQAALLAKADQRPAENVRVYEKIKDGIWVFNGTFALRDCWVAKSENRNVFKFRLELVDASTDEPNGNQVELEHNRIIPAHVKLAVWKRDGGKCVKCGCKDNLHFDHIIPYSLGGSSLTVENIQLLCVRHNLQKRDRLE